jgi:hypothetical protein
MTLPGMEDFKPRKYESHSSLCTFLRCPRRYFLEYGMRLDPFPSEQNYFVFGRAMHAALPWCYFEGGLINACKAFDAIWPQDGSLDDEKRTRANAYRSLKEFYSLHAPGAGLYSIVEPPKTGIKNPDGVSPFEIPFAVDVGGKVPFVGLVDGMGQHNDTGAKWLVEFKTSYEMGSRFAGAWSLNSQVISYHMAVSLLLQAKESIAGVFVEGVLVAKSSSNNLCIPIFVNQEHWNKWIQTIQWAQDNIERCIDKQNFPCNFSACTPYPQHGSMGYMCSFEKLCHAQDWRALRDYYKTKPPRTFVLDDGTKLDVED